MRTSVQVETKAERNAEPFKNEPDTLRSLEKHFSPKELGELWGLSSDTIRRLFHREPGVLVLNDGARGKRRYRTVRIPASVAERLHRRLTKVV
jgi:hypothetical protein